MAVLARDRLFADMLRGKAVASFARCGETTNVAFETRGANRPREPCIVSIEARRQIPISTARIVRKWRLEQPVTSPEEECVSVRSGTDDVVDGKTRSTLACSIFVNE